MTAFLLLFSLMGVVAGFTSARFYKIMDFAEWRSNTLYAFVGLARILAEGFLLEIFVRRALFIFF